VPRPDGLRARFIGRQTRLRIRVAWFYCRVIICCIRPSWQSCSGRVDRSPRKSKATTIEAVFLGLCRERACVACLGFIEIAKVLAVDQGQRALAGRKAD